MFIPIQSWSIPFKRFYPPEITENTSYTYLQTIINNKINNININYYYLKVVKGFLDNLSRSTKRSYHFSLSVYLLCDVSEPSMNQQHHYARKQIKQKRKMRSFFGRLILVTYKRFVKIFVQTVFLPNRITKRKLKAIFPIFYMLQNFHV